jgi:small subunit ribosomal protein S13
LGTTKLKPIIEGEEKKEYKKAKKPEKPKAAEDKELRTIVRVMGADLDGEKPIIRALRGIKGISYSMSKAVIDVSGYDGNMKLGSFGEQDIQKIEQIIRNPENYGIPAWMLNRRKDRESGKDMHYSGSDLIVSKKFDIQRMIDLKTYKGNRHMLGLPVRGQRTRSSFRKGRVVGVVRKAVLAQMQKSAGPAEEKKKEEKK